MAASHTSPAAAPSSLLVPRPGSLPEVRHRSHPRLAILQLVRVVALHRQRELDRARKPPRELPRSTFDRRSMVAVGR